MYVARRTSHVVRRTSSPPGRFLPLPLQRDLVIGLHARGGDESPGLGAHLQPELDPDFIRRVVQGAQFGNDGARRRADFVQGGFEGLLRPGDRLPAARRGDHPAPCGGIHFHQDGGAVFERKFDQLFHGVAPFVVLSSQLWDNCWQLSWDIARKRRQGRRERCCRHQTPSPRPPCGRTPLSRQRERGRG